MYAYQIVAGNNGQDLAEINTLNHYIGMKPIAQADFLEMKVHAVRHRRFRAARASRRGDRPIVTLVDLVVLFLYFGVFSLGSFAYRLYSYGHHLDPQAPMKITPFMPVVIGSQQIANFVQTSLPLAGTFCMAGFFVLLVAALWSSVARGATGGRVMTAPLSFLAGVRRCARRRRRPARRDRCRSPEAIAASRRTRGADRWRRRPTRSRPRPPGCCAELARAPPGATIEVPAGRLSRALHHRPCRAAACRRRRAPRRRWPDAHRRDSRRRRRPRRLRDQRLRPRPRPGPCGRARHRRPRRRRQQPHPRRACTASTSGRPTARASKATPSSARGPSSRRSIRSRRGHARRGRAVRRST